MKYFKRHFVIVFVSLVVMGLSPFAIKTAQAHYAQGLGWGGFYPGYLYGNPHTHFHTRHSPYINYYRGSSYPYRHHNYLQRDSYRRPHYHYRGGWH